MASRRWNTTNGLAPYETRHRPTITLAKTAERAVAALRQPIGGKSVLRLDECLRIRFQRGKPGIFL